MNDMPKPNGPRPPFTFDTSSHVPFEPRPRATFPDEVELEIRRQVTRHHNQVAEIAELKTDRDTYRQRSEVAEAEITLLMQKQRDLENRCEELQATITTLATQFDNSAEILIKGIETLKRMQPKTIQQMLEKPQEAHDDLAG
jgi:Arc/MetJ-type ribon-helix-helix transcriptional regulator